MGYEEGFKRNAAYPPTYNFFDYTLIPCSGLEDQIFSTGLEAFFLGKFTLFLSDIEKATFSLFSWFFTLVLLF